MDLLEQVESYLARTETPPSTFGRMALGDPRFVRDLKSGRKPRRRTQERLRQYLADRYEQPARISDSAPGRHSRYNARGANPDIHAISYD